MRSNTFYDTKMVPVVERESFNNTILLLTMVKSQYYYIIGFSRPNRTIKVGFDYDSKLHSIISETIDIDFGSSMEEIKICAVLENIVADNCKLETELQTGKGKFYKTKENIVYECNIPKDKVLPAGIADMNNHILSVKEEIGTFLEEYYIQCMMKK